jgi:hypothetical protein
MTALQKSMTAAAIIILVGGGVYETHRASQLRAESENFRQQQAGQIENLVHERDRANLRLEALRAENDRLKADAAKVAKLRGQVSQLRKNQSEISLTVAQPAQAADGNAQAPAENVGHDVGMAVVRGEPGAFEKLSDLAKQALAKLKAGGDGLNDEQRGQLSRSAFASLRSAFSTIEQAAVENNEAAIDAIVRSMLIPELRANAAQALGVLAGNGNDDALEALLNPNYGLVLSTTVGALQPAAEKGNQKAIDVLAGVAADPKQKGLWFMAATGLSKAAAAGNETAVQALIELAKAGDPNLKAAVVAGLEGAANRQNAKALETLRLLGVR